jgi:hypothetical protein
MLRYLVIQHINGNTDWYDRGIFEHEQDAIQWIEGEFDRSELEVVEVRAVCYEVA